MNDLAQRFEQAQQDVVSLAERPNNATLLKLYAYYKQATAGDAAGEKPGLPNLVDKKKYEARSAAQGMSTEAAMQAYVDEVTRLLEEE